MAMTNIKAANMKKDGNKIWYIGEKKSEGVQAGEGRGKRTGSTQVVIRELNLR